MSLKIQVKNTRHGNPGVSGWYAILPEPEPERILQEDITVDWLVIGAGFAGLAAARRLSQLRENESKYCPAGFNPYWRGKFRT